jgi:anthranilate synthase/aminodeoxychorismate synthase-like glutamine amidotransferase
MILVIDNYDSFVYNLARYVRELGGEAIVRRNDAVTVGSVRALSPSHIILSPGPRTPADAGVSTELVRQLGGSIPTLGVCLGHQCVGVAYGGTIVRAQRPMHGKASLIRHSSSGIFQDMRNPMQGSRYHSLAIERGSLPEELMVTATDELGEIMAIAHRAHPVFGVQFHPESILTEGGHTLLRNFLEGASRSSSM